MKTIFREPVILKINPAFFQKNKLFFFNKNVQ